MKRLGLLLLGTGVLLVGACPANPYDECTLTPASAPDFCAKNPGHLGATLDGFCLGGWCFNLNAGAYRQNSAVFDVVAQGGQGEFPKWWTATTSGNLSNKPGATYPCTVSNAGTFMKTIMIDADPAKEPKCVTQLNTTGNVIYYEHFVSNPTTQCLGWVSCKAK